MRADRKTSAMTLFLALLFATSTILMYQAHAVAPAYSLTGTWTWNYYYGSGTYTHTMTISSFDSGTGAFSGIGHYNANPAYTWTVDGIADGFDVTFTIDYTGLNPNYYVDAEGTISADGTHMSGTATAPGQSATWDAELESNSLFLTFPVGSTAQVEVEVLSEADLPPCVPPLPEGITPYFVVEVISGSFSGSVEVCLLYDDTDLTPEQEQNLRLYMGACVDFNLDGTVNGEDLSLIKKAIKRGITESESGVSFDVNNDDDINEVDVDIVKQYKRKGLIVNPGRNGKKQARLPWIDITTDINIEDNIICGETDHFSIFGVH